jgi:reactive intermediate/imine deaminase
MSVDDSPEVEYYAFPVSTSLPFSAAVRVGNLLFVSGQMGTNEATQIVPGGIEAETRQTIANMKAILERHGSSLDRVVKCTVMMADMGEWAAMNSIYVQHFRKHLPARSAFGCAGLALGGRVEIECIATVDT